MKKTRPQPGLPVSAAAHVGLLLAALLAFPDARKFDDAQEVVPIDIVTDSAVNEVMKGEKTAKETKPIRRVDRLAETAETKPLPPLAEAKKDISAPPPPLRRRQEEPEDRPEAPPPPKRIAALPPKPEPPARPTPPKPEPPEPPKPIERAKAEPPKPEPPKPEPPKPEPPKHEPPKPQAKAAPTPPEREPEDAEVVRPKPPPRPLEKAERPEPEKVEKPAEKQAKPEPPKSPEPPKPPEPPKAPAAKAKDEARLKVDEVAKLLERKKSAEKAVAGDGPSDSKSDKPAAKPKSGDETAPKSKFDAASISNLLSREAPQRRAATGKELAQTASLGAPNANAARMSPTVEARINAYLIENYRRCWQSALQVNARVYVPTVEFHLTRAGALDGPPKLLNPSSDPVERSRGEQALTAIRRCSPMPVPEFFAPYYEHWRSTVFNMTDDM